MSICNRIEAMLDAAIATKKTKPIVSASVWRYEQGIKLKSIGCAIGVWAFCNHDEDHNDAELQAAVEDLRDAVHLEPQQANEVWQSGRAMLLALEIDRRVKLGSPVKDEEGFMWDCCRDLYIEALARIRYFNPGLGSALDEAAGARFFRSSDFHWGMSHELCRLHGGDRRRDCLWVCIGGECGTFQAQKRGCEMSVVESVEDREKWLADRRTAIGASDVAAIVGVSPYQNGWEVWADKRGLLEPFDNPSTEAGRMLEPVVLSYAEKELGALLRNVRIKHGGLPLAATCDAIVESTGLPVEAKTTGICGPVVGDWGDELTDQVPDYYLVQVHAQLMCTGAELGYLFALLPGRGFCQFHVRADRKLHDHLGNLLNDWWDRHVIKGFEPSLKDAPNLEVVRRLKKTPGKVIEATEAIKQYHRLREQYKETEREAKKLAEECESRLLIEMGDAEAVDFGDGKTLTYLPTSRKGYTVEPCTYRQLRMKGKGKS